MKEEVEFPEDDLAEALRNSASCPEPSDEHVDSLGAILQTKTRSPRHKAGAPASPSAETERTRVAGWQLAALAAVVVLVVIAIRPPTGTASASLSSALIATRDVDWVHATTVVEYLGESFQSEAWCSPRKRIVAFQSPQKLHFVNYSAGTQSSYSDTMDTVYRWRANMHREHHGREFVHALLNDGDLNSSFPWHDVGPVEKQVIEVDGQPRVRFSVELELKRQPSGRSQSVIHVDPASRRLLSWDQEHANGSYVTTTFDYPASGPGNIYDLGADTEARVVDRIASSDVMELSEKFQRDVYNFDNYEAFVVDRMQSDDGSEIGLPLFRRLQRSGRQFRIDLLTFRTETTSLPNETTLQWWIDNLKSFDSTPLAVCDGESCTLYPVRDKRLRIATEMSPRVNKETTKPAILVENETGTTTVPIWPTIWPEYACRPYLLTSDPTLRFELDPAPSDSLRLRVLVPDSPFSKVRAAYWLSLDHDRCVTKSIRTRPQFDDFAVGPTETAITSEFYDFRQSRGGVTFATKRTVAVSGRPHTRVTTFAVDFAARD